MAEMTDAEVFGTAAPHMGTRDKVIAAARRHGVPEDLALEVAHKESRFNQNARSPKGAMGVMQLMPGTASDLGVDPNNEDQNIDGGVRYIGQQLKDFGGDRKLAMAAYNAGPGNVRKYGGVPPFAETQNYVGGDMAREMSDAEVFGTAKPAPASGQPGAAPMPQRPAIVRASAPAAMPKADVAGEAWSGFTQPFRDLGANFMAGVENQRRIGANPTAAMPRNVSQFLKSGVEGVKDSASLVGGTLGLLGAPIQAGVRPIAAAGARAGLQPSVGGDKLTFVNGKPVVAPYRKTSGREAQAVIEGDINTALSAARPATVKPIVPKMKGMTLEAVKEANTKAWTAVDASGYRFPTNQVNTLAADVRRIVQDADPVLFPEADKVAGSIERLAKNGDLSPAKANRLRSIVGEKLLAPGSTEASVGGDIKAKIDGLIDSANDPSLAKARELHMRVKKMEEVSNRLQSADLAQETAGTAGNQNAVRQKLRPLIDKKSPQRIRNLTGDETAAIRKVTKGTPAQNAMRLLTAFDPTAGKLQALLSTGAAGMSGGASLGMMPVGMAAKIGERAISQKNIQALLDLISTGGRAPTAPAYRGISAPYRPLSLPAKIGGTGTLLAPLPQVQRPTAKTKATAKR